MKIVKVTLAGISDILYHATKTDLLLDILKENKIRMSADLGAEPRASKMPQSKKFRPYYLSLSRVKFGGYSRTLKPENLTIIELDGVKLKQKYAGEPVDYWGETYRNLDTHDTEQRMKYNENEDRIYSDHPFLEPLSKYIKSIHVMLKPEYALLQTDKENISDADRSLAYDQAQRYQELQRAATVHGLKIYFYPRFNDLKALNTKKSITNLYTVSYEADINHVNEVFEAIITKDYSKLSKGAQTVVSNIPYYNDYLSFLKNAVHNSRTDTVGREAIDKCIAYMRRFKLRSIPEAEEFIKKRLKERYQ